MATKGLYQKLIIKCLNLSHPPRYAKKCHATEAEEDPVVTQNIQCLQRGGGVALIQTKLKTISSTEKVVAAHGLRRPKQAKQINKRKTFLLFEAAAKSWESPTFQQTTKFQSQGPRSSAQFQRQNRSASSVRTHLLL